MNQDSASKVRDERLNPITNLCRAGEQKIRDIDSKFPAALPLIKNMEVAKLLTFAVEWAFEVVWLQNRVSYADSEIMPLMAPALP
jgi:hypothetical protein